jgi:hypothetical protein
LPQYEIISRQINIILPQYEIISRQGTQSSLEQLLLFESEEAPGVPLKERNRLFVYTKYMGILDEGTKPIGLGL